MLHLRLIAPDPCERLTNAGARSLLRFGQQFAVDMHRDLSLRLHAGSYARFLCRNQLRHNLGRRSKDRYLERPWCAENSGGQPKRLSRWRRALFRHGLNSFRLCVTPFVSPELWQHFCSEARYAPFCDVDWNSTVAEDRGKMVGLELIAELAHPL